MPDPGRRPWWRLAGRLALELLVVFVGVYAAFLLAQHGEERAREARRATLQRALAEELGAIAAQGASISGEIEALDAYLRRIRTAERPRLVAFNTYIPFSTDVWRAALASGGVELLPPDAVLALSAYYGRVEAMLAEIRRGDDYTRTLLLPAIDAPLDTFYDDDGTLRAGFAWYANHLERMIREARGLTAEAARLHELLADA